MTASQRAGVSIALDGSTMAIVWGEQRALRSAVVDCDGSPESIASAIAELSALAPAANTATITLCRPLAERRVVRMPSMARAVAERILARDWNRHIIGHRATAHDVSATIIGKDEWTAAFAPADTLEAIGHAADEMGWHDLQIQTSDDALGGIGQGQGSAARRKGSRHTIVCDGSGPTDALRIIAGNAVIGRRFLPNTTDDDVVAFIKSAGVNAPESTVSTDVTVIGDRTRATMLTRSLGLQGYRAQTTKHELRDNASALAWIAAAALTSTAQLPLASGTIRARTARSLSVLTWRLLAGAAAALLIAFLLARQDVERKLVVVRQHRADISAQVRDALDARMEIESAADAATILANRENNASRAATSVATVATALPRTATLTSIAINGDSMMIEGEGPSSAEVYAALKRVQLLEQLRLAAPLRQERQGTNAAIEHFAFSAHVKRGEVAR